MKALGMARTAEVKRDARIGEADAKRDAQIKEAIAEEERMAARLLNDAEIAKSKRDFELKKAAYDVEVQTKVSIRSHLKKSCKNCLAISFHWVSDCRKIESNCNCSPF